MCGATVGCTLQVILNHAVHLARPGRTPFRPASLESRSWLDRTSSPPTGGKHCPRPRSCGSRRTEQDRSLSSRWAIQASSAPTHRFGSPRNTGIDSPHCPDQQIESNNEYRSSGCTELIGKYRVDGPLRPGVTRVAKGVAVPDVTRPHQATRASKLLRQGLTKRHQRVPGGRLGRNCYANTFPKEPT